MGGPTLEDVTKAECPDDKPYKCLPYGSCFGPDSYCDPKSGTVESCFPHQLTTLQSKLAYCQDIGQNITKLIHKSCAFACKFISEGCDKPQVCESCEDVLIWKSIAITVGILCIILFLLGLFFYHNKIRKWRTGYRQVIHKRQETKADGGEEAEARDLGVQTRNSCEENVNLLQVTTDVDVRGSTPPENLLQVATGVDVRGATPPENLLQVATGVDVGGATSPENQTQNQQPCLPQQDLLEISQDIPHLQQPSLNNRDSGEMPPGYSSGNASSVSSPSSSSVSSVGTSDDSGVGPAREGHCERAHLGQQSSQTSTNQSFGSGQQIVPFVTSTSIPEGKSTVVTSASGYEHRD